MTGGVGFSSQGKDSFRNNRKLLNNRTRMKDNPYAAGRKDEGDRNPAHTKELQVWRDKQHRRHRRLRLIIYGIFTLLTVVIALLATILSGD